MKSLLNALQEGRLVELPDTDKGKSLEYLANLLEAVPDLPPAPQLYEAMMARERAMNTGIGMGVACPHVRAPGSGDLLCAVGWSPSGIDYGAPDGKKVQSTGENVITRTNLDAQSTRELFEPELQEKRIMNEPWLPKN